jgi:rhomboid protease GluP
MIKKIHLDIQPYTFLICALIIAAWIISALHHELSLFQTQKSRLILSFGAINGESLQRGEYWKLLTAQFLHVMFLHMLLDVGFIYFIGAKIEKIFGPHVFLSVFLLAGLAGTTASVLIYPQLTSSGSSQALCGIVGAFFVLALFPLRVSRIAVAWAGIFVLIQVFLDLYFAGYVKAGHYVGFLAGLLLGVVTKLLLFKRNKAAT